MFSNFFKSKPKGYNDLDAKSFQEGMKNKNAVIIDVRSAGEFASGKLKGARNIDLMGNFAKQIAGLPKDKEYYLYCRSGNRSGSAAGLMASNGFENVNNLKGGIMSWPFDTV
ncbi:rhodanese-like domain-containing protein [Litoribacter ruber]|uniref:Rhodanese-like domain-containing protein n=1 Tax=Litoribacter ruber TaxID=702568 RepID=A0AAP2CHC0_9BACT|nr:MULTISPECIES: rhodanese-like domain-containing protein [Litoribacter]MBS9524132.1 rhodanese-like domain-containing protein [Litoribacter alkaliphilus]MBT0810069.1 rhodanese-like domain-containing protein [Litoribacter ruber]